MKIKSRKTEIETINMSFKRLLIFPFQYLAEYKENLLSPLFNLKISIYQYIPGLPLVKKSTNWSPALC